MTERSMPNGTTRDAALRDGVVTHTFSTRALTATEQLLAWRARVGHVVDVPPSKQQLSEGFNGHIDFYGVGGLTFTDCSTDAMVLERSVARVSTDANRNIAFHMFLEGGVGSVTGMHKKRSAADPQHGIVALDLNQPFKVERGACRVLTLFVPRQVVAEGLPDVDSIHGRVVPQESPLARLILDHAAGIVSGISKLDSGGAADALNTGADLLIAAFRHDTSLKGADRASLQAAIIGQVRRYVEASLHRGDLTPASVVDALQLKRSTIYRWFEHEGGLGAYIRNCRLRAAADELVRYPHLPVTEIAYGLGFNSTSDFSRAFRRAFEMSPQEMRARALVLQHGAVAGA
ncbi:helix-turn-helix domain-containing protein [Trinickia violacea]|uniref:Helix-turn-helix domain-containing protein n=1 Tax=Trinickia violacea TaxID=2571746 RepID=A0A4P8J6Q2_9BURK|nr:helix-turn-helix domain-containing protein [Trinickia violacea]QCP54749.1 helix-turn-helix domain-containing protein [Trinickia violacea]